LDVAAGLGRLLAAGFTIPPEGLSRVWDKPARDPTAFLEGPRFDWSREQESSRPAVRRLGFGHISWFRESDLDS
jgi:hypothetical protein